MVDSYGVQFDDPTVAIEFDSDPGQAIKTRQAVLKEASETMGGRGAYAVSWHRPYYSG